MQAINLILERDEGPDAGENSGEHVSFDPRDPRCVRRAQAILQERFGLAVAPILCSEPGSRFAATLRRGASRFLKRLDRSQRLRVASDPRSA
jgi:hypothetical protein